MLRILNDSKTENGYLIPIINVILLYLGRFITKVSAQMHIMLLIMVLVHTLQLKITLFLGIIPFIDHCVTSVMIGIIPRNKKLILMR